MCNKLVNLTNTTIYDTFGRKYSENGKHGFVHPIEPKFEWYTEKNGQIGNVATCNFVHFICLYARSCTIINGGTLFMEQSGTRSDR